MRHFLFWFFLLVMTSRHVFGIDMTCKYDNYVKFFSSTNEVQTCEAFLIVKERNVIVETVNKLKPGIVFEGEKGLVKSKDISSIRIRFCKAFYMPKGLENFFPKLKYLTIKNSYLRSISKADLKPFVHLKELDLSYNEILYLNGDLLQNNQKLQYISFDGNKNLKHIAENILSSMKKLQSASFENCGCTNIAKTQDRPFKNSDLIEIQNILETSCPKIDLRKRMEDLEDEYLELTSEVEGLDSCDGNLDAATMNLHATKQKIEACAFWTKFDEDDSQSAKKEDLIVYCEFISERDCKVNEDFVVKSADSRILTVSIDKENYFGAFAISHLIFDRLQMFYLPYFNRIMNLEELTVTYSGLYEMKNENFENLENLKSLNFSHNKILEIEDEVFYYLPSLEKLDLSFNNIEQIQKEVFTNLAKLEILKINNNKLTSLDSNVFDFLVSLQQLFLNNNQIKLIYSLTLTPLTQLKTLDLTSNICIKTSTSEKSILEIEDEISKKCGPQIEIRCFFDIDLKYPETKSTCNLKNLVTEVPKTVIKDARYEHHRESRFPIKTVTIISQSTPYLPYRLSSFFSATKLVVEDSNLTFLYRHDLEGFTEMKTIQIRSNNISFIEDGAFDEVEEITFLDLSFNNIKGLPQKIFSKLSKLKTLILSSNELEVFNADVLSAKGYLDILRLENNKLKVVDVKIFEYLNMATVIDLTDNVCIDSMFEISTKKKEITKTLPQFTAEVAESCHASN